MRKVIALLLLAAVCVGLAPLRAVQAQADEPAAVRYEDYAPKVVDYTLPNGLRVILAPDDSAPVVAVDIWYDVGGANDPEARSGFAHLYEHMMFEGSENVPNGEWDRLLESIGANNNAYTANDKTAYWETAAANQLPRLLWMESDRMRSLDVTDEAFQNQRAVVIQEYNQRVANQPYGRANSRLFVQPMQGYWPYERPVIGSVDDLNAASYDEVVAFHSKYYKPNNATLVIAGDIDVAQTQALVEAYFGDIPAGEAVTPILKEYPLPETFPAMRTDAVTGCKIGTEETLVDPTAEVPRLGVTVVGPKRGDPEFYALRLLTDILGAGDSSRLEQEVVQNGLAASAYVGLVDYAGASILYGIMMPNEGDTPEQMWKLLADQFAAVRAKGVSEDELARVKAKVMADTITGARASMLDTAEWLQDATLNFGDPNAIGKELDMYAAVTAEDVQAAAQKYLCDRPMHFQTVIKEGQEVLAETQPSLVEPVAVAPAAPLTATESITTGQSVTLPEGVVTRESVPAALGELASNFPPFETFTLDNGLDVIFVEQHKVPKLHLQLVVGGSNPAAAKDKQGVADFLAELITKGTLTRSAQQIEGAIEAVGGTIDGESSLEWTSVSVDALTPDTRLAFNLLSDVARHATFPQKEFDVVQDQTLTFLAQDKQNPTTITNDEFGRVAYGEHPYGYIQTEKTVGGLTRQDVVDFYKTYYRPNNAHLVIVGDMTPEQARYEAERAFSLWQAGDVPDYLKYPESESGDTSKIYLVDRPESEQATIQIGNRAVDARDPDRYALEVLNALLGRGSSSRLFANLREDKGYTYGVYSRFARPNDRGTFRVIGDFDQPHTGDAVREILSELARVQTEPIGADELDAAKGQLLGGFALGIEDPADFANQLVSRRMTGIPLEELNDYLKNLEAVTAEDVQAAAAKHIESRRPIIVVVANAEAVRSQLEEIKPVEMVTPE